MKRTISFLVILTVLVVIPLAVYSQTAPFIKSTYPANKQSGISKTARVSITFSEPMDLSSMTSANIYILTNGGDQFPASLSYSNRTLGLLPLATFDSQSTFYVIVEGDVRDSSGDEMGRDYKFQFTTGQ